MTATSTPLQASVASVKADTPATGGAERGGRVWECGSGAGQEVAGARTGQRRCVRGARQHGRGGFAVAERPAAAAAAADGDTGGQHSPARRRPGQQRDPPLTVTHPPAEGRRHQSAPCEHPPGPAGQEAVCVPACLSGGYSTGCCGDAAAECNKWPTANRHAGRHCPSRQAGRQAHRLSGLNVQHVQDHRLVGAQHGAARNHGADGIADLACRGAWRGGGRADVGGRASGSGGSAAAGPPSHGRRGLGRQRRYSLHPFLSASKPAGAARVWPRMAPSRVCAANPVRAALRPPRQGMLQLPDASPAAPVTSTRLGALDMVNDLVAWAA